MRAGERGANCTERVTLQPWRDRHDNHLPGRRRQVTPPCEWAWLLYRKPSAGRSHANTSVSVGAASSKTLRLKPDFGSAHIPALRLWNTIRCKRGGGGFFNLLKQISDKWLNCEQPLSLESPSPPPLMLLLLLLIRIFSLFFFTSSSFPDFPFNHSPLKKQLKAAQVRCGINPTNR